MFGPDRGSMVGSVYHRDDSNVNARDDATNIRHRQPADAIKPPQTEMATNAHIR